MSAALLLGIGAVGVGWIALSSSRAKSANAADLSSSAVDQKTNADVGESQNNIAGTSAMACEAANGTMGPSTLGGSPVQGVAGKQQTVPIEFSGPSGEPGIVVDREASLGGGDPSTLKSTTARSNADDGATFWRGGNPWDRSGNVEELIYTGLYGPVGSTGTTEKQRSIAYAEFGAHAGEVW